MKKIKQIPTLKAEKRKDIKEFKPKPWLRKPDEEKIVQGYYYVKAKHKDQVKKQIDKLLNELK